MKVLRIIENVLFIVAVTLSTLAVPVSLLLDEGAKEPVQGVATSSLALFVIGSGFFVVFLLLGAFMKYSKGEVAKKVGEALVLAATVLLFFVALTLIMVASRQTGKVVIPLSAIVGLIGGILYVAYMIFKGIIAIVNKVKPEVNQQDPDADGRIQAVLKWKSLLDQNIITKAEFEEKRVEILGLEKPEKPEK